MSSASLPAGPSLTSSASMLPPESMQRDDYVAADAARLRLNKRGLLSNLSLPTIHRKSKRRQSTSSQQSALSDHTDASSLPPDASEPVQLTDLATASVEVDENYDKDVYRWAVLYENQRGITIFSSPNYSAMGLLPMDPQPFTVPSAYRSPRAAQPTVSLTDFPLPDGSWRWVSRAWMIDMHGDGRVQYDGFEYSWSFRSKKWQAEPGRFSLQGLVRRRRWVRLMMRPAQVRHDIPEGTLGLADPFSGLEHQQEGATRPPSVVPSAEDDEDRDASHVWRGDEEDWTRCHMALRRLGRDGRKLELWARWLGLPLDGKNPRPEVGRTTSEDEKLAADTGVDLEQADIKHVAPVIRSHGSEIMGHFIYPDSRAQFVDLLGRAGLLPELHAGFGVSDSMQILDFWSYTR